MAASTPLRRERLDSSTRRSGDHPRGRERVYLDEIDVEWLAVNRPDVLLELVMEQARAAAADAERARCLGILRTSGTHELKRLAIEADMTPSEASAYGRPAAIVA